MVWDATGGVATLNHRLMAGIPSVFAALRRDVPGWLDMVGTMRNVSIVRTLP